MRWTIIIKRTSTSCISGRRGGKPREEWWEMVVCFEWKPSREGSVSYTTHAHSAYPCTACAVEKAQGCRSIWEHPTVHTYDPWGLGSGQSVGTTQITRAAGGGVLYGNQHLVETGENHEKKMFWSFKKIWKKCGMLRGWCFIATQNFKLKHIKRC